MGCGASTGKGHIPISPDGPARCQGKQPTTDTAELTRPALGTLSPTRSNPVTGARESSAEVEGGAGQKREAAVEEPPPTCPSPRPPTPTEVPTQEAPSDAANRGSRSTGSACDVNTSRSPVTGLQRQEQAAPSTSPQANEPTRAASPLGSGTPGTEQPEGGVESPVGVTAERPPSAPLPSRPPSAPHAAPPPPLTSPPSRPASAAATGPTNPNSTADSATAAAHSSTGAGPAVSAIPAAAPSVEAACAKEATATAVAVASKDSNSTTGNDNEVTGAGAPSNGASTSDAARPDLSQALSTYYVHQTMCVAGLATNVTELTYGQAPAVAAELVDLWRVWREEWYGFPTWEVVIRTRNDLLKMDGLWMRLSNPERRMVCEYRPYLRYRDDSIKLFTLLLERCALRRRASVSASSGEQQAAGHAAPQAAGAQPQLPASEQASEQPGAPLQGGSPKQGEEQEDGQAPPGAQDLPPPDPHAALDAACCTLPGAHSPCEAAVRQFPATFVTAGFVERFAKMHHLSYVPEGPGSYGSPAANLPSLEVVTGRTHNLTVRQVWERVVAPALEATGGMTYAEAFLSYARDPDHSPDSDLQVAVGVATGMLRPMVGQEKDGTFPERFAVMVPPSPEQSDGDFMHLQTALKDAVFKDVKTRINNGHVCLWVDLFCSATGPPRPAERAAATAAAAAALARCKAVAVLAPATGWPLAAPAAVSCASAIAAVLDPVRQHGLQAMLLRLRPPEAGGGWMPNFVRELEVQQRYLTALEAAEEPPPLWAQQLRQEQQQQQQEQQRQGDGGGQGAPAGEPGDNGRVGGEGSACGDGGEGAVDAGAEEAGPISGLSCDAAVRQLWGLYRESAMKIVGEALQWLEKKKKDILWMKERAARQEAEMRDTAEDEDSAAADTAAALGPPYGDAAIRITRVARLEGLPEGPTPDEAGKDRRGGPEALALAEAVLDEQVLRCPAGMTQAEADELVRVWVTEWACMPDLCTVLRTWAACGGGHGAAGTSSGNGTSVVLPLAGPAAGSEPAASQSSAASAATPNLWASMTYGQRRTACELVLLYGSRTAATLTALLALGAISPADKGRRLPPRPEPTVPAAAAARWRPSPEAEAEARAASSRGVFVTAEFLRHFLNMHDLGPIRGCLASYPGQAVWNPCRDTSDVTTSWVCANIVLPATQAYGTGYSDLLLAAEAQAALLPPARDGTQRRFCLGPNDVQDRAFASHAWGIPFTQFTTTLLTKPKNAYWIDIFQKNQHQSVAISDLADNLRLSGQLALVIHPFPEPLVLSRVWCLFEVMTALQVGVPVSLFRSPGALEALENRLTESLMYNVPVEIPPEVHAEIDAIDVATAQATVPADKELIMGMIRDGMGVDEMNRQVRELVRTLLGAIRDEVKAYQQANLMCFGGDGLVRVPAAPLPPPPPLRRASGRSGRRERNRKRGRAGSGAARAASAVSEPTGRPGGDGGGGGGSAFSLRRVADLRPGDTVLTAAGGLSRVVLVTRDEVGPEGVELCAMPCDGGGGTAAGESRGGSSSGSGAAGALARPQESAAAGTVHGGGSGGAVGGGGASAPPSGGPPPPAHLLVTPDHPVLREGVWVLPRSVAPVVRMTREQVPYGAVYNLELDPPAPLLVSGVVLVALGQDISGQPGVGVTQESCRLYGWGWRSNPQREQYVREQRQRQERQRGREIQHGFAREQVRERQREKERLPLPREEEQEGQGGSGEHGVGQRHDARSRAV